jgi:hypothetical membrane protein
MLFVSLPAEIGPDAVAIGRPSVECSFVFDDERALDLGNGGYNHLYNMGVIRLGLGRYCFAIAYVTG